MIFTLEALRAKQGDCLLLHYGEPDARQLVVVDGGPTGVFDQELGPRLAELKAKRPGDDPLPIRLLLVSHIDDDHIKGVLDLTRTLVRRQQAQQPPDWEIAALWHNSFDDLAGEGAGTLAAEVSAGPPGAGAGGARPSGLRQASTLVLASVDQGRTLRLDAQKLALELNPPAGGLITGAAAGEPPFDLDGGLALRPVGPSRRRVADLQKAWAAELARRRQAPGSARVAAAAYDDKSVFNLSSLAVVAEAAGRRILLTGDARGDDLLSGLEHAGLLTDGKIHVDVLKMPHHGSDRNVETEFFRRVTADHYVFSGNGKYGNPEVATFEMIFAARGPGRFTLHLTYAPEEMIDGYPAAELTGLFAHQRAQGVPFEVATPKAGSKGLAIVLGDDL